MLVNVRGDRAVRSPEHITTFLNRRGMRWGSPSFDSSTLFHELIVFGRMTGVNLRKQVVRSIGFPSLYKHG